jgi:beta-N-acetylhexosaminidase
VGKAAVVLGLVALVAAGCGPPARPVAARSVVSAPRDCVAGVLASLTLEQRVGQLLIVGTPVDRPADVADELGRYHLGGVFLAGRSTRAAAQLRGDVAALQREAGAVPLHVATDQEGGYVQSLGGADFPPIPTALVQGGWDVATLRARTTGWARRLAAAGVTLDLAPVADTVPAGTAAANPPIGGLDREYGAAPQAVAGDVATVVSALQSTGILATLKHFPGLGRVRANTDTSSAAVDAKSTVDDPFLAPFVSGIRHGAGAVMVSSARYPSLDHDTIAAFSAPIVTGLLRDRLGYTGLVVSDDLGAAAAVGDVPVGERAVRFVGAGGDAVLTVRAADAGPMYGALLSAAQASPAFRARVDGAAGDVLRSKYAAGLLPCAPPPRRTGPR